LVLDFLSRIDFVKNPDSQVLIFANSISEADKISETINIVE
jgi:hypothetical protein